MLAWLPCAACQRRADPVKAAAQDQRALGDDYLRKKQHTDALTAYSKAISLQPKEAVAWLRRSSVYEQLGDWQQALRDATRAVQLQADSVPAICAKAAALQKLGRVAEALADCEAGLALRADSPELLRLRGELREADAKATARAKAEAEAKAKGKAKDRPGEAAAKPAAKKSLDLDYSKWADLEDSDEEKAEAEAAEEGKPKGWDPEKWEGPNPTEEERLQVTDIMLEVCRKSAKEAATYFGESKAKGVVRLPPEYRRAMGVLSVKELAKYSCSNKRMLVSIYGDIYDVSHRPDLYGYGPKSTHAGKDITWAIVLGKETAEHCNRFYDIFKLDEDHLTRYLQIVCQRKVYFEEEFGDPIGRLQPFVNEWELPPAPTEEIDECKQQ